MTNYKQIINDFSKKHIVVVGDVMLDKYVWGDVERISPEAPVPILHVKKETFVPGGAANVGHNIAELGAHVSVVGLIGKDEAGKRLIKELERKGVIHALIEDERPTIQKVRVLAQNQQLLRIDYEETHYAEKHVEDKVLQWIKSQDKVDAVIISDYAKGIITKEIIEKLVAFCAKKSIPLLVDPRPKHYDYYKGCTIITPNLKETKEMLKQEIASEKEVIQAAQEVIRHLGCDVLITRGKDGMSLITKKKSIKHIPTKAREVFDVSGAGDTVVAALTLSMISGASLEEAALIANHAAGVVVGKVGTATLTPEELLKSLEEEQ